MLDLDKINYFISEDTQTIAYSVKSLVDFLDLDGLTPLYIIDNDNKSSSLKSIVRNSKIKFNSITDFEKIIEDKSNLFRVDLLIVDLTNINSNNSLKRFLSKLEGIKIKVIILSKSKYIEGDDVNIYKFEMQRTPTSSLGFSFYSNYKYIVTDIKRGWTSDLESLKLSYIRDKKIDNLFRDD